MTTACASCRGAMSAHRFENKLHGAVELDLCFSCQGIWFDAFESLQLSPGGIVALFKLIHEQRDVLRVPLESRLRCPRCDETLLHAMDKVKSGAFNYYRCLQQHGRFTSFGQFMIEKGFVRQMTGAEVVELQARVDVVRCGSCGAPVDIRKETACGHCHSPIAILDRDAVEQALAGYHQAEIKRTTRDPSALADAILESERQKSRHLRSEAKAGGALDRDVGDLVVSGVELVWGLFRH